MTASFVDALRKCGLKYTQGPVTRPDNPHALSTFSHVSLATPDGKLHPNVVRNDEEGAQIVAKKSICVNKEGCNITLSDLLHTLGLNLFHDWDKEVFVETQCSILPRSWRGATQFCPVLDTPGDANKDANTLVIVCSSMGVALYMNNTPGGWLFMNNNGQSAWYGAEANGGAGPSASTSEGGRGDVVAVVQVPIVLPPRYGMLCAESSTRSTQTARVVAGDLVGKRYVPAKEWGRRDERRPVLVTICSAWVADGEPTEEVAGKISLRMAGMSFSNLFGAPPKATPNKPVSPVGCGTDSSFLPNVPPVVTGAVYGAPSTESMVAICVERLCEMEAAHGSRIARLEETLNRLYADFQASRKELQKANEQIRVLQGKLDVAASNLADARARPACQDSASHLLGLEMRVMRDRITVLETRLGSSSGATAQGAHPSTTRTWGFH